MLVSRSCQSSRKEAFAPYSSRVLPSALAYNFLQAAMRIKNLASFLARLMWRCFIVAAFVGWFLSGHRLQYQDRMCGTPCSSASWFLPVRIDRFVCFFLCGGKPSSGKGIQSNIEPPDYIFRRLNVTLSRHSTRPGDTLLPSTVVCCKANPKEWQSMTEAVPVCYFLLSRI